MCHILVSFALHWIYWTRVIFWHVSYPTKFIRACGIFWPVPYCKTLIADVRPFDTFQTVSFFVHLSCWHLSYCPNYFLYTCPHLQMSSCTTYVWTRLAQASCTGFYWAPVPGFSFSRVALLGAVANPYPFHFSCFWTWTGPTPCNILVRSVSTPSPPSFLPGSIPGNNMNCMRTHAHARARTRTNSCKKNHPLTWTHPHERVLFTLQYSNRLWRLSCQ